MKRLPAFLVAGTHSGVGKTTATFAFLSLLAKQGFKVQPFKIGPDFIDGGYHRLATGRDSINLDLWMMGWNGIQESFQAYSSQAEVSVLEGMGALYDGKNGTTSGSSAEIAKRLKVPVLLVVDIWGMTVTTGAVLEGLLKFDSRVKIAGILLNRAGSRAHFDMVMKSLKPSLRSKVIGYLLRSEAFEIPERHLGLKTLEENKKARQVKAALVKAAEETVDLSKFIKIFKVSKLNHPHPSLLPSREKERTSPSPSRGEGRGEGDVSVPKVRIGVAKDPAFCFYYAENLRMLEKAGAKLVYFSPLKNRKLPPDLGGFYLGGGYPESFSKKLSANKDLRREILRQIKSGMPVYAECGGLMYLSESLVDFNSKAFPMVSALPLKVKMEKDRFTIRYVELKTTQDSLLGPKGTKARGQEFHHSRIISNRFKGKSAYQCVTSTGKPYAEGFQSGNLLASYIHLHFKSNPSIAESFVKKCRKVCVDKTL